MFGFSGESSSEHCRSFGCKKVKMTAMPQMVSIFNGMGGACAALISLVEYNHLVHNSENAVNLGTLSIILLGLIIGSVSFAGSMIAWEN
jgi:NAD(P) transhydrogenase subunit beta